MLSWIEITKIVHIVADKHALLIYGDGKAYEIMHKPWNVSLVEKLGFTM